MKSAEELMDSFDEIVTDEQEKAEEEEEQAQQASSYASKKTLRVGNRIAGVTPDGLRLKVLDAVPEWENWPRKLRQMFILLPTHGRDINEIAEAVGLSPQKLNGYRTAFPAFFAYVEDYWRTGHYPEQKSPVVRMKRKRGQKAAPVSFFRGPIAHAHLVQHYANESAVLALLKLEQGLKASDAARLVEKAGWFSNIESDTAKHRANMDIRIEELNDRQRRNFASTRGGRLYSGDDEDTEEEPVSLPKFAQDIEPDGGFDGVTESAK